MSIDENTVGGNSLRLNGGTIRDATYNDANLTHNGITAQTGHKVSADPNGLLPPGSNPPSTAPVIINSITITSTPGIGDAYKTGERIQATVTFSDSVTVTGTPQLALKIGTTYKQAVYESGTGSNLFFAYTIVAGDVDTNGISIDADALSGGTITGAAGNAADLTNTVLYTQPGHKVDTITDTPAPGATPAQPTVSSMSLISTGPYGIWDNIQVRVTTTTPVTVTGSPTLGVIIGNTEKRASYQSGSGSMTLNFQYTVAAGDGDDPNGISVKANSLSGGTITDTADNTLNPNYPALPDQGAQHRVDTSAPEVSSITFSSTGPYGMRTILWIPCLQRL